MLLLLVLLLMLWGESGEGGVEGRKMENKSEKLLASKDEPPTTL